MITKKKQKKQTRLSFFRKRRKKKKILGKIEKKTKPFPFQKKGIDMLVDKFNGRALLADDVGLGKSIQSLYASLPFKKKKRPIIVVCPSAVKLGWEVQVRTHTSMTVQVLNGRTPPHGGIQRPADVIIINWDILSFWVDTLLALDPCVLITDESHYAKDGGTKRTKAWIRLGKQIDCIYCLSGTAFENEPTELFTVLNMLQPKLFPSFRKFAYRYSKPVFTRWGVKFKGAQNKRELNKILRDKMMVRRLKLQVLKDLPPLIREVVPMQIDEKKYQAAKKDIIGWLHKNKKKYRSKSLTAATKLNHLLTITSELKFKAVCEWIDDFLENTDKKLTVFGHHRAFLERLNERYKDKSVLVYGGIGGKKRKERIAQFVKKDKCRLFIGGIMATGTGINDLQLVCNDMAIVELIWVGLKLLQVEGRLHRIGQKHQVNVRYLLAHNTVEEMLCKAIQRKQKNFNHILDSRYNSKHEFDIFESVIHDLMKSA